MTLTKDEITRAVSNIVYTLELKAKKDIKEVVTLAKFIGDIKNGTYQEWDLFRQEISNLRSSRMRGRGVPIRPHRPKGDERLLKLLRPKPLFLGVINLNKCKDNSEKIKAVLETECTPKIKKEFLDQLKF